MITSPPAGPTTRSASITALTMSPSWSATATTPLGAVLADGWFSGYIGFRGDRDALRQIPARARPTASGICRWLHRRHRPPARLGKPQPAPSSRPTSSRAKPTMPGWNCPAGTSRAATTSTGTPSTSAATKCIRWCRRIPGRPCAPSRNSAPGRSREPKPGVFVLDLGQNFAGVPRLKVSGKPGQKITLRFAERLNPDGTIYTAQPAQRPRHGHLHLQRARAPKSGSRASPSTASNTSRSPA